MTDVPSGDHGVTALALWYATATATSSTPSPCARSAKPGAEHVPRVRVADDLHQRSRFGVKSGTNRRM